MIVYSRGDVVLVGFVFSDESGKKLRPAIVISSAGCNIKRRLFGDHLIADWKDAGLLFPSVATGILRTIKTTMIERKLGSMAKADLQAIDRELRRSLSL
ncbi:MAG TPA: type II toxin-antitoxin system PemK/MazF family toxin [Candidatus Binatia bacterium]|nr:type II toxin-antitoxin system PemK/MazF family toxin [Candidatus Binatia bacterium]